MMNKFVLLRPDGGLNDIFCQIEKYACYAEQTNRILIVDTAYKHSQHFNDEFGNYFTSRSRRLILSATEHYEALNKMSVFPHFLTNRVNEYQRVWNTQAGNFCDVSTNLPISFQLNQHYPESLLLVHESLGGENSFFACARMRLNTDLKRELKTRLETIGGPYHAIHIRHTDYQTDYESKLLELSRAGIKKLFVATDNKEVLQDFRRELGADCVYSFSELTRVNQNPLHRNASPDEMRPYRNTDAICDLLLLALAEMLHILPLKNPSSGGSPYSGFSLLAKNLWTSKIMLKRLLS